LSQLQPILKTLVIAAGGGFVFNLLNIPLPWMLGAVAALIVAGKFKRMTLNWPMSLRDAGLMLLGYNMGRPFTIETGQQIIGHLPAMVFATLFTIGVSFITAYLTYRQTEISFASSLIGSVPGGLSQMVVLCDEVADSDIAVVSFMQTIRLLSVVFVVPLLTVHGLAANKAAVNLAVAAGEAGAASFFQIALLVLIVLGSAAVARYCHWPTPYLLGPMLGTAAAAVAGVIAPKPPDFLVSLAQLSMGAYMGASIKLENLGNWRKLLPYTLLGVAAILAASLLVGYLLAAWESFSLATAFLSTAPGGMAEMGLTAMAVNADISVVIAFQLFRLLFILTCLTPFLRWWLNKKQAAV